MTVVRVRRPETIADPRIKALILRAVEAAHYPGTGPQAFYDEIAAGIASDTLGVFVGFDDGEPKTAAIAVLPTSAMCCGPQIPIAYSENRDSSRRVGEKLRAWIKAAGHDRLYGVNFFHDDAVYRRVFRHVGELTPAGTIFEVRI